MAGQREEGGISRKVIIKATSSDMVGRVCFSKGKHNVGDPFFEKKMKLKKALYNFTHILIFTISSSLVVRAVLLNVNKP